jgi:hypothetical protein
MLVMIVGLTVLVAGCGGSGSKSNGEAKKAASQVLADALAAAQGASGVHVSGSIVSGGEPLTLDLGLDKGTGGSGTMSENGLSFQLIRVGGKAYIKGSDAFYKKFAGAGAAQLLHGKWLEGSATTGNLAALTSLTDISKLFNGALASHGKLSNGGETTYKEQKVVAIKDTSKDGILYVAATGTPYPVAIVGANKSGAISFDEWGKTVTITAPKNAVDLDKLG